MPSCGPTRTSTLSSASSSSSSRTSTRSSSARRARTPRTRGTRKRPATPSPPSSTADRPLTRALTRRTTMSDLTQAHKSLTDHLETLESQLQGSLAKWDGAARSAYATAKATWDKAARHMQEVIQKSGTVLGQITENYDSNERRIQSSWQ